MARSLRYGDFLGAIRLKERRISFNALVRVVGERPKRARLRALDAWRLIGPYSGSRLAEQARAVLPIAAFLVVFQLLALQAGITGAQSILYGIVVTIAGLALFMEGVRLGLMPFAENIGRLMPQRARLSSVLAVAFALGVLATLAEPAIGALQAAGALTDAKRAPVLAAMLTRHADLLVMAVGLGVGSAVLLGILRMMYGWRLKTLILITLTPCIGLTLLLASDPKLASVVGLAWDCGAVTTGPVTVPLVLAIGVGVASAAGDENNPLSGFGIVTLASLFPAIAVMLLALWAGGLPEAAPVLVEAAHPAWYEETPFAEALGALRAILPLILFLWVLLRVWLKEPLREAAFIAYGIAVAILGMLLFSLGLAYGLNPLGEQTGTLVPAAFANHPDSPLAPLYGYWPGIAVALGFAAALGLGATIAEPALSAMGITVETLTEGAFPRKLLIRTVAIGVAAGVALGVAKIVFDLQLVWLLLPAYAVALGMTIVSSEEYVNLAWDSAGVTTGPVTVPLVLALGLGLGKTVGVAEGFGVLAMASVGPIVSVLAIGLWIALRKRMARRAAVVQTEGSVTT